MSQKDEKNPTPKSIEERKIKEIADNISKEIDLIKIPYEMLPKEACEALKINLGELDHKSRESKREGFILPDYGLKDCKIVSCSLNEDGTLGLSMVGTPIKPITTVEIMGFTFEA